MKLDKKTIVFDLDDTLCYANKTKEAIEKNDAWMLYGDPKPNQRMISQLRVAWAMGYKIIIYTSRRMITRNGNVRKIRRDVEKMTKAWLKKYGIPWDQIVFGKPYGVYYVDDKAIRPNEFLNLNLQEDL